MGKHVCTARWCLANTYLRTYNVMLTLSIPLAGVEFVSVNMHREIRPHSKWKRIKIFNQLLKATNIFKPLQAWDTEMLKWLNLNNLHIYLDSRMYIQLWNICGKCMIATSIWLPITINCWLRWSHITNALPTNYHRLFIMSYHRIYNVILMFLISSKNSITHLSFSLVFNE